MKIVLHSDGPLDVGATLARYHIWGEDPVNVLDGDVFRRALRHDGRLLPYEVRWSGPVEATRLVLDVPGARSAVVGDAAVFEVRRLFGLDFDLPGFYRMAKADPVLGGLVEPLYGMRPTLAPTAYLRGKYAVKIRGHRVRASRAYLRAKSGAGGDVLPSRDRVSAKACTAAAQRSRRRGW